MLKFGCLIICITIALPTFAASADDAQAYEALESANQSYQDGNYERAVDQYHAALADGLSNGHVYYNLANALYRAGRYGEAIANYRRALLELPADPDVLANLKLARERVTDKIIDATQNRWLSGSVLLFPYDYFSREKLLALFLATYLIFWVSFVLRPLTRSAGVQTLYRVTFVLVICGALLLLSTRQSRSGGYQWAFAAENRKLHPAVVVVPEAKVYSGNAEKFQVIFVLHEGAEIEAGEERDPWVEILLSQGRKGWVKKDTVALL